MEVRELDFIKYNNKHISHSICRMLCKGDILEAHISERRAEGVKYDFVAFCGDGTADLGPNSIENIWL